MPAESAAQARRLGGGGDAPRDLAGRQPEYGGGVGRALALQLQDEALAITRDLGMRPLTERILARRELLKA